MVSYTFLLCSSLLLSVAIAAPYPDAESAEPSKADVEAEVDKQAVKSAQKVLTDVADGIDMHESLLHRSMKLVDKILYEVKSVGHSLKKRIDELKRGDSVGDVVGRMWHAFVRKVSGKNKTFDDLVAKFGSEHIQKFISGAANMIKGMVVPAVKEGKEIEDVVDKKAEEKWEKMAEEFKPQAN